MLFLHVAAVLAVVLVAAKAGREAARLLRQPEVIGEITMGLLAGPVALALLGPDTFASVLPKAVLDDLKLVGQAGLVLFLVGLAHHMRRGSVHLPRRAVGWVAAGSLVLPLLSGVLLAVWILTREGAAVRGTAPLSAFVLMVAVSLSISAVPVMARILDARRMQDSTAGALTLSSAIVIDAVGWLLLTLAVCLGAGSVAGFLHSLLALAVAGACGLAIRFGLATARARSLCVRAPRTAAVALGAAAIAVAVTVEHMGMTAILGAAVVGLSIPSDESSPWSRTVEQVSRAGSAVVPVFFVVTGINVFNKAYASTPWGLITVAVLLGIVGKTAGGYLGARLGGQSRRDAQQISVLMNTRGLTELIAIQAGLQAGILTGPLVLALVLMALATTAMTGPLLAYMERSGARLPAPGAPELRAPRAVARQGS
ncbi:MULTISPECIES: cation:proton antiporter [unclassified Kitasatospora]|uniref:cation:proton antiporter n=1 Tax=unclassified Kitasatospora TaxID=2633591 RepID=UPI001ADEED0C|nr:cation:proton antiporter [Kitasatospora sp. RG8]MBP0452194.1 cation:proton antiporter [Kitasatospora sp. RG8]